MKKNCRNECLVRGNAKKSVMFSKFCFVLMLWMSFHVSAEGVNVLSHADNTVRLKGVVTDAAGKPLPGVTVQYSFYVLSMGTKTGVDGKFSVEIPDGVKLEDIVLAFSVEGKKTVEIKLKELKDKKVLSGKKELKVTMEDMSGSSD